MRISLLRDRRYSAISKNLLLSGIFFISFFGAIGYFALEAPARADSLAAPTTPTPVDGGAVNGRSYAQTWSAIPGAVKYEYKSYNDAAGLLPRVTLFYSGPVKQTDNIPDSTIYWWKVRAVDSTGAVGPWSPLWKTIVDNVAPTTTLQTSAPTAAPNLYKIPPTITGTVGAAEKNLASHTFTVTNPQGGVTTVGPVSTASFTHSFTLDTSAGDGAYTISYSALDKAGNKSAAIAPRTVVIDTTAPDAPQLAGEAARTMQPGNATHTWAPSTASDVKNYIFKSFASAAEASAPDASTALVTETLGAAQTSYTQATGSTDGTYWYRVAAVDNAGNQAWSAQTYSLTVDATAPAAPALTVTGVAHEGFTNNAQTSITWNKPSSDTTSYKLEYWNTNPESIWKQSTPKTIEVTGESWSGTLEGDDGVYTFRVQAIDHVGNASPWSTAYTLSLDTDPPAVTLDEIASFVGPADVLLKGSVADATISSVQILLGGVVVGEAPVSGGAFSYPLVAVAVGSHTVAVKAFDAAANDGLDTKTFVVTAPVVVTPSAPTVVGPTGPSGPATAAPQPASEATVATEDTAGEVFNEVATQTPTTNRSVTGGGTDQAQEIKGIADTAGTGGVLGSWWGWVLAAVVAVGGFWWLVAVRRRRRAQEE